MPSETVVAVYNTFDQAQLAIQELERSGIGSNSIRYYSKGNPSDVRSASDLPDTATHTESRGFWAWLFGEEETSHASLYENSLQSGNVVVTVITDTSKLHEVIRDLELHNPIDIDEGNSGTVRAGDVPVGLTTEGTRTDVSHSSTLSTTTSDTDSLGSKEEVIPLREEQLEVGKRSVEGGSTRIRRYTTDRPVEETIRLRDERVTVERHSVDGGAVAPGDAFVDKVVEVAETSETPVIGKTTRVVEEVVVGKDVTERSETIRDTVRKEDIEVDKGTGTVGGERTVTSESSVSSNHPNLEHPIETVKDTLTGEPTPAQRQATQTDLDKKI